MTNRSLLVSLINNLVQDAFSSKLVPVSKKDFVRVMCADPELEASRVMTELMNDGVDAVLERYPCLSAVDINALVINHWREFLPEYPSRLDAPLARAVVAEARRAAGKK